MNLVKRGLVFWAVMLAVSGIAAAADHVAVAHVRTDESVYLQNGQMTVSVELENGTTEAWSYQDVTKRTFTYQIFNLTNAGTPVASGTLLDPGTQYIAAGQSDIFAVGLIPLTGLQAGSYRLWVSGPQMKGLTSSQTSYTAGGTLFRIATSITVQPETPWQTNAYGTLFTGVSWNYNMGYQFTPLVNGKITKLGGFFSGTKTIRLYDSSGSALAIASNVAANNSWGYGAITPVPVIAGQTYTVAVNLAGSGGSYRVLPSTQLLPQTFGHVRILSSVYLSNSDLVPTTQSTSYMYGQADVEFVSETP